ncbi:protein-L-isoaspartate(D-aspartate) O-methyltransferase [Croceifilum oryzae]|uniref:Protein-L-isoaspartate O-methyltransferase n=1 Tax=Croceifilum oryzae TaxID=1553429 RepID=A0AAJ1WSW1_9BACL|nr:methyltransferase domain-containing protein [Croceifilum oryzae]MDQ0418150.1 protein-L-isoaspartate(D-aspartate) O-methyltransferase [Croceifilum oryzae]
MTRVDQVLQQVDYDYFVVKEDGKMITQSTASGAIQNGLEMLDVKAGQHVMEIGTGSGFSGALLATLVGATGSVVSIDIEPHLTSRARELCENKELNHIFHATRDGRKGFESGKPYDRIIAWTTPESFPVAWSDQLQEGGLIVIPFQVLPIARCIVTVCLRKVNGVLQGESVSDEGYIMMSTEPMQDLTAGYQMQAELIKEGEEAIWASSMWMKSNPDKEWLDKFAVTQSESSTFEETGEEIRPYLLGINPEGLTSAFHPETGYWIGYSSLTGFALVSGREPKKWLITDQSHADVLCSWWDEWKKLDKPSFEQLQPVLVGDRVEVRLKGGE